MNEKNSDSALSSIYALLAEGNSKTLVDIVEAKYKDLGLTENQFCNLMNFQRRTWKRIISGEQQKIDISVIIKLANFLGLDVKDIIQIYISNANPDEIHELENTKKNSFLVNNFDLRNLKKVGFIDNIQDLEHIQDRIVKYFNLNNIFEYRNIGFKPLFKKAKIQQSDKMLAFWKNTVWEQFQRINNPYPYDEAKLLSIIPKIRESTLYVSEGFTKFIKGLFECGLTVIVETYCSNTGGVQGATFNIKNKPYIVLTNFQRRYDMLWFTLAHEISHVINDMDYISQQGYHVSGDSDLFTDELQEDMANTFAQKMFISDKNSQAIESYIDIDELVKQQALSWNVHPSLVYGNYLHKYPNKYGRFRKYLLDSTLTIKNIEIKNPYKQSTIEESVQCLNQLLMKNSHPTT